MGRFFSIFAALWLTMSAAAAETELTYKILSFDQLDGWEADDHDTALSVFRNTCMDMNGVDWKSLCAMANDMSDGKAFFELMFRPVLIEDGKPALFTGYFEPELDGSRYPTSRYKYPVYRLPREARANRPWLTRRDILTSGVMDGRGLEIAWVDDPVELFFLQVQGSGRIRLPDGSMIRVGYGGKNGHEYKSLGRELVRRGIYQPHQVSAQVIKNWVRRNPMAGEELLYHNPSYVFVREVTHVPAEK